MDEEYRRRLTKFFSYYVDVAPKGLQDGIMTDKAIQQGIKLLLDKGVFSFAELRKVVLRDFGVLMPKEEANEQ